MVCIRFLLYFLVRYDSYAYHVSWVPLTLRFIIAEVLSKFGSGLFLLVQVVMLLDFTNNWNDSWVEKDEKKWWEHYVQLVLLEPKLVLFISLILSSHILFREIALLVVTVICYLSTFAFSGVLFMWFNPSDHDCGLNVFFIVLTIILAFAFAIIALHPQVTCCFHPFQ